MSEVNPSRAMSLNRSGRWRLALFAVLTAFGLLGLAAPATAQTGQLLEITGSDGLEHPSTTNPQDLGAFRTPADPINFNVRVCNVSTQRLSYAIGQGQTPTPLQITPNWPYAGPFLEPGECLVHAVAWQVGALLTDPVVGPVTYSLKINPVLGLGAGLAPEQFYYFKADLTGGTGLRGRYFDEENFTSLKTSRVDPQINFLWNDGLPTNGSVIPQGTALTSPYNYSIRWSGTLRAPETGEYTFRTVTDDGVRLYIDGSQIIDDFTGDPPRINNGTITLNKGQEYTVRMDYFQSVQGSQARLRWILPSGLNQVIPQLYLYPS